MMAFHYPSSFYLFIPFAALFALYAWSKWRRLRDLQRLGHWRLISQLVSVDALTRRRAKDRLALIGLSIVIFSATGPQFGSRLKEVKQRGVDVFIAMDTSRSMLAEDVPPSRLERAKRSLGLLINKLEGNRVGIIAFAKRAIIQCPLTVDNDAARMFLEVLDDKTVPEQGTAVGDAIRLAIQSFLKDEKSGRAIVLLTDGEDHSSDPIGAAKEAKEAGVVIFTIGIGTSKGEVIKDRDENGKIIEFHKYKGEMVLSRLDDGMLTELATLTDGRYYRASSTDEEIDEIGDILNGFEKKEFASKIYERLQERYQIFLWIGLLLLLIEFFFAENPGQAQRIRVTAQSCLERFPKKSKAAAAVFALLFFSGTSFADFKTHVRKGNRLLKKGDPAGARAEFESAQNDVPEAPFLPYNIAATHYLDGNFEEAKMQYEKAMKMSRDPGFQSKVAYNLGHMLFNMGRREQSIEKFKECLKLNPSDMDAKYNIEYIKAGNQPKNPPPQQQKPDKNKSGGKNENQDNNPSENEDRDNQGREEEQKKPGDLSQENAERILQMMKDQESEKMKNAKMPKPMFGTKKDQKEGGGGEDW